MIALRLDRVSKIRGAARRAVHALQDVSVVIHGGELVLLEGPSGAGKTTLLGVAAGLLTPTAGDVWLAGRLLAALTPAERRAVRARQVGFVFQRSNLLARLTVGENVALMQAMAGRDGGPAAREVVLLLEELGIAALAGRRPQELSGGEEQRAAVARALVHRPAIVLADEPTGNLDSAAGRSVAAALAQAASGRGAAVLVATHDSRLIPYAARRLHIEDGCVSEVA
jgi:putative ABC transport system ATP-binding protein